MSALLDHWFALALLALAPAAGGLGFLRRRPWLLVTAGTLTLAGTGGLLLSPATGRVLIIVSLASLLLFLIVLDRSASIPEDLDKDGTDRRWARVRRFLNDSVRLRPADRRRDQVGLIVFGRRPRLELLPGDAPRFNFTEVTSDVDGSATDI